MDSEKKKLFPYLTFDFVVSVIFLLMMLMYYPFGIVRSFIFKNPINEWPLLLGFSWEIIGYFALALVALKANKLFDFFKKHLFAAGCAAVYILILILQQIFIFPSFYYFGGGISYIALAGVGFLYAEEWKKLFLPLLWILLFVSIFAYIHDFVYKFYAGLAGNWNWSSTLTLISGTSIFFIFGQKLPAFERKWGIYFSVLTVLLLFLLYYIGQFPKGTILSGFIGLGILLWCYLDRFFSRKMRIFLLAAGMVIIYIFAVWQKDSILAELNKDTRSYLWENGLRVIASSPLIGCEYGRYISVAADKMATEYFLSGNAATSHDHPHNEFLFLLANFGIGGIALILLMLYNMIKVIHIFERKKSYSNGFFLFIYSVLLIHSMVDVLLMHWPCNVIFYLLAGAIIPMLQEENKTEEYKKPFYLVIVSLVCVALGSYLLYMNFMSSMYIRLANKLKRTDPKRLEILCKSVSYRPVCRNIYDIAVLMTSHPQESLNWLLSMKTLTGIENFFHSNYLIANLLADLDKPEQSLIYHEKEYNCFPLSIRNLYFFRLTLKKLNKKNEVAGIENMMLEILKAKKLELRHIDILLKNPQYDLNSNRIPEKLLNMKRK